MTSALQIATEILQRLERIDADEGAKRRFRDLVETVAIAHGIHSMERAERIDFARRLHEHHVSRATIRERLIARYGISSRQAYRVINDCIQLCQRAP